LHLNVAGKPRMALPEKDDALHKKGRMKIKMAVVKERAD
jgi:hypothetical protein